MGKSGDSFFKKEREKKKQKKKQDKEKRKEQRKLDGKPQEFMYQDSDGNLLEIPPDPANAESISPDEIQVSVPKQDKSAQPLFSKRGILKFFNEEKGYGFIQEHGTQERYFVHASNLSGPIKENTEVVFRIGKGPKGPIATEVEIAV